MTLGAALRHSLAVLVQLPGANQSYNSDWLGLGVSGHGLIPKRCLQLSEAMPAFVHQADDSQDEEMLASFDGWLIQSYFMKA